MPSLKRKHGELEDGYSEKDLKTVHSINKWKSSISSSSQRLRYRVSSGVNTSLRQSSLNLSTSYRGVRVNAKKKVEKDNKNIIKSLKHPKNIIDSKVIDDMLFTPLSYETLKQNMISYFGTKCQLAEGRQLNILGSRISPENKVEYLVKWL
ncbi:hypothetical protein HELRODRAFT_160715 [Helobdella robusta]|uniref:Polycomb-like MTF2 factor 2 C-terminal domain-containing protein n=1 Tax=Helobdella robusta TaxID=6412 RepID=T1EQM8_HELRO|nr:hypothetical protein HELRODRAFT_160715 [Helobdella robusta]ESO06535.1 hypothetical protein HELRODRAFT_160715 [Helobdella robusta]